MLTLSITQVFGEGSYQDANVLVIQKSSLLRLTPLPLNTAESLLSGILVTALSNFKGTIATANDDAITDENGTNITFDNSDLFEFLKMIQWRQFQISRNSQKYIDNQIIVERYTLNATN